MLKMADELSISAAASVLIEALKRSPSKFIIDYIISKSELQSEMYDEMLNLFQEDPKTYISLCKLLAQISKGDLQLAFSSALGLKVDYDYITTIVEAVTILKDEKVDPQLKETIDSHRSIDSEELKKV
jgi:hypothetical protein